MNDYGFASFTILFDPHDNNSFIQWISLEYLLCARHFVVVLSLLICGYDCCYCFVIIIMFFIPFSINLVIREISKPTSGKAGILFHKLWMKSQNLELSF